MNRRWLVGWAWVGCPKWPISNSKPQVRVWPPSARPARAHPGRPAPLRNQRPTSRSTLVPSQQLVSRDLHRLSSAGSIFFLFIPNYSRQNAYPCTVLLTARSPPSSGNAGCENKVKRSAVSTSPPHVVSVHPQPRDQLTPASVSSHTFSTFHPLSSATLRMPRSASTSHGRWWLKKHSASGPCRARADDRSISGVAGASATAGAGDSGGEELRQERHESRRAAC